MATLTAEETELYDRQIRAWGFEAQKRMRESKILVVGLDGAGSETLKNLVLAGLGDITILEDRTVDAQLVETHFYLQSAHVQKSMASVALSYFSEMNPNIKLTVCTEDAFTKSDEFYQSFDVVICSNHSRCLQLRINAICHKHGIGYFGGRSMGHFGYIFADLQQHQYQVALKGKSDENKDENVDIKKIETLQWCSLESALAIPRDSMEKQLRGKSKRYRSLFYAMQICEQTEDVILQKQKVKESEMGDIMKSVGRESSPYYQIFKDIEARVNGSGQFSENSMARDQVEKLCSVWNLSVCPANAMLGGYLANFVMFYVQRKQKPLYNFLFFDLWGCEAMEIQMMNAEDAAAATLAAKKAKEAEEKQKNAAKCAEIEAMDDDQPDMSKLNVNGNGNGHTAGGDEVVLLDDSDDEDIDLID